MCTASLWRRTYNSSHFSDAETKSQRSQAVCSIKVEQWQNLCLSPGHITSITMFLTTEQQKSSPNAFLFTHSLARTQKVRQHPFDGRPSPVMERPRMEWTPGRVASIPAKPEVGLAHSEVGCSPSLNDMPNSQATEPSLPGQATEFILSREPRCGGYVLCYIGGHCPLLSTHWGFPTLKLASSRLYR
jgi:hypothetical protein